MEQDKILENKSEEEGDEIESIKHNPRVPEIIQSTVPSADLVCLTARTALLLPYKWSDPTKASLSTWVNEMLKRKFVTADGSVYQLYKESKTLPDAVADLDSHFRQTLGWNETAQDPDDYEEEMDRSGLGVDEVCSGS